MTLDEFRLATQTLFHAFNPYKAEDRLKAYYEILGKESGEEVERACKQYLEGRGNITFPSIAEIKELLPKKEVIVHAGLRDKLERRYTHDVEWDLEHRPEVFLKGLNLMRSVGLKPPENVIRVIEQANEGGKEDVVPF